MRGAGRQRASVRDGNDGNGFNRGQRRGHSGHGRLCAAPAAHTQGRAVPVRNRVGDRRAGLRRDESHHARGVSQENCKHGTEENSQHALFVYHASELGLRRLNLIGYVGIPARLPNDVSRSAVIRALAISNHVFQFRNTAVGCWAFVRTMRSGLLAGAPPPSSASPQKPSSRRRDDRIARNACRSWMYSSPGVIDGEDPHEHVGVGHAVLAAGALGCPVLGYPARSRESTHSSTSASSQPTALREIRRCLGKSPRRSSRQMVDRDSPVRSRTV